MEKYHLLGVRGDKNWPDIDSSDVRRLFLYQIGFIKFIHLRNWHYTIRRKQSTNIVLYRTPEDYKQYLTHEANTEQKQGHGSQ